MRDGNRLGWRQIRLRLADMDDLDFCVHKLRTLSAHLATCRVIHPPGLLSQDDLTKTLALTHGILERLWSQVDR